MAQILLADDDSVLAELLIDYLEVEGFAVLHAENGAKAVSMAGEQEFDLIVLDVMMPEKNGFEALREIRAQQATPVLMLTARGDDIDRIVGLEMGADDYLPKPCNPRELVARIRAILRRTENTPNIRRAVSIASVQLVRTDRTVKHNDVEVDLTSTEFNILEVLMDAVGTVISKNELSERALGRKVMAYDRSLDMHISNLRKKLGVGADGKELIKTVRGVGYIYVQAASQGT